jgi:hypothetical protein
MHHFVNFDIQRLLKTSSNEMRTLNVLSVLIENNENLSFVHKDLLQSLITYLMERLNLQPPKANNRFKQVIKIISNSITDISPSRYIFINTVFEQSERLNTIDFVKYMTKEMMVYIPKNSTLRKKLEFKLQMYSWIEFWPMIIFCGIMFFFLIFALSNFFNMILTTILTSMSITPIIFFKFYKVEKMIKKFQKM